MLSFCVWDGQVYRNQEMRWMCPYRCLLRIRLVASIRVHRYMLLQTLPICSSPFYCPIYIEYKEYSLYCRCGVALAVSEANAGSKRCRYEKVHGFMVCGSRVDVERYRWFCACAKSRVSRTWRRLSWQRRRLSRRWNASSPRVSSVQRFPWAQQDNHRRPVFLATVLLRSSFLSRPRVIDVCAARR